MAGARRRWHSLRLREPQRGAPHRWLRIAPDIALVRTWDGSAWQTQALRFAADSPAAWTEAAARSWAMGHGYSSGGAWEPAQPTANPRRRSAELVQQSPRPPRGRAAVRVAPVELVAHARRALVPLERLHGFAGEAGEVLLPTASWRGFSPQPIRWAVVEAADLIPSHVAGSWTVHPRYPRGVQERDYSSGTAERRKVEQQAATFAPRLMISDSATALEGAPVVTAGGLVVGGNSRVMTLHLVLREPGRREAYRSALAEYLARTAIHGDFPRALLLGMDAPVLVRILELTPAQEGDLDLLRQLVARANQPLTQAMDPRRAAASAAARLSAESVLALAASAPQDAAPSAWLAGIGGRKMLEELRRAGILTPREEPRYLTADGAQLNEVGRTFALRVLAASVLDDPELLDDLPGPDLDQLAGAAAPILSAAAGGYDLRAELREMLRLQRRVARADIPTLEGYARQAPMPYDPPKRLPQGPVEPLIWRVLHEQRGIRKFPQFWRRFATLAAAEGQAEQGALGFMDRRSAVELLERVLRERAGATEEEPVLRINAPLRVATWAQLADPDTGRTLAGPWDVPDKGAGKLAAQLAAQLGAPLPVVVVASWRDPLGQLVPVARFRVRDGRRMADPVPMRVNPGPAPVTTLDYARIAATHATPLQPFIRWLELRGRQPTDAQWRAARAYLRAWAAAGSVRRAWGVPAVAHADGPELHGVDALGYELRIGPKSATWDRRQPLPRANPNPTSDPGPAWRVRVWADDVPHGATEYHPEPQAREVYRWLTGTPYTHRVQLVDPAGKTRAQWRRGEPIPNPAAPKPAREYLGKLVKKADNPWRWILERALHEPALDLRPHEWTPVSDLLTFHDDHGSALYPWGTLAYALTTADGERAVVDVRGYGLRFSPQGTPELVGPLPVPSGPAPATAAELQAALTRAEAAEVSRGEAEAARDAAEAARAAAWSELQASTSSSAAAVSAAQLQARTVQEQAAAAQAAQRAQEQRALELSLALDAAQAAARQREAELADQVVAERSSRERMERTAATRGEDLTQLQRRVQELQRELETAQRRPQEVQVAGRLAGPSIEEVNRALLEGSLLLTQSGLPVVEQRARPLSPAAEAEARRGVRRAPGPEALQRAERRPGRFEPVTRTGTRGELYEPMDLPWIIGPQDLRVRPVHNLDEYQRRVLSGALPPGASSELEWWAQIPQDAWVTDDLHQVIGRWIGRTPNGLLWVTWPNTAGAWTAQDDRRHREGLDAYRGVTRAPVLTEIIQPPATGDPELQPLAPPLWASLGPQQSLTWTEYPGGWYGTAPGLGRAWLLQRQQHPDQGTVWQTVHIWAMGTPADIQTPLRRLGARFGSLEGAKDAALEAARQPYGTSAPWGVAQLTSTAELAAGARRRAAREALPQGAALADEPLATGQIFYASWGYEQTNIDFYQLVRLSASRGSGDFRQIGFNLFPGEQGSDRVTPRPGQYEAELMRNKRIQHPAGEQPRFKVTEGRGTAHRWDGRPLRQTAAGYGH